MITDMETKIKLQLVMFLMLGLPGCAGTMGNMSPDQLSAIAANKNSAVVCTDYTGAGGKFSAIYMNQEKIVSTGGGEAIVKCPAGEVSFKDSGKSVPVVITPAANTVGK